MNRKEIVSRGLEAGAMLAVTFWFTEFFSYMVYGAVSFLIHRQSIALDLGDSARSLPAYLLFCIGVGIFIAAFCRRLSYVYTGLLMVGVSLFEWASRGQGALRILGGSPWVRREIWTLGLVFFGILWGIHLRRMSDEEIKREGFSSFLVTSIFLVEGQHVKTALRFIPAFRAPLQPAGLFEVLGYGVVLGFAFLSVYGFFWVRKRIRFFVRLEKIRNTVLLFSLGASFLAYCPPVWPAAFPDRPNIILLILDTVRPDHLSSYGYFKKTSPSFDRLVREGVLIEGTKSTSHWTLPAHASLFTGFFPSQHGATWETLKIQKTCKTLAEHLRAQGYRTVGFSANPWVGELTGLDRGFDQFVELWRYDRRSLATRIRTRMMVQNPYAAPHLNLLFDYWLRYQNPLDQRPFFLFINYVDAHSKYEWHPGISESFFSRPWSKKDIQSLQQDAPLFFAGKLKYRKEEFQLLSDLYDGEIAYLDHFLGELIGELRQRGILDRSILVVTSDHGEYLGEHGLINHMAGLYEEVLRVPFLIRYPGRLSGSKIHAAVQLTDVPPTLLELAHLPPLEGIEGKSFAPLLFEKGEWSPHPVVAEQSHLTAWVKAMKRRFHDVDFSSYDYSSFAFQEGTYKVIFSSNHPPELYDLANNEGETRNLYATLQDHPIFDHLATYLAKRKKAKEVASTPHIVNHPATVTALRSLGYL